METQNNKNEIMIEFKELELSNIVIKDLQIRISFVPMSEDNQKKALCIIDKVYSKLIDRI